MLKILPIMIALISLNAASAKSFLVKLSTDCIKSKNKIIDGKILKTYPQLPGLYLIDESASVIKNWQKKITSSCIHYVEKNIEIDLGKDPLNQLNKWNDPHFADLWYLLDTNLYAGIHAQEAWNLISTSPEQVVAVVDSGIDYTHPDLQGNMWINYQEQSGIPGVDDDNNGFVDDIHGWNFVDNTSNPIDQYGHGTHCAGTIGATSNNQIGIAGVTHQVKLMALKFLNNSGRGNLDDAVSAILYAVDNGATIISNSWGHQDPIMSLGEAVEYANNHNVLFVAAAGNNKTNLNNSYHAFYPASYPHANVISVAAHNEEGNRAAFSNYGNKYIDIAAPGTHILSTLPNNQYGMKNGTSMATPIISGSLALMRSYLPDLNIYEIKERLLKSTDKELDLSDKVSGQGRLNLYNALVGLYPEQDWPLTDQDWPMVDYQLSSEHPTLGTFDQKWTIHFEGAKYLRILFDKVDLSSIYDLIYIYDKNNQRVELIQGQTYKEKYFSPIIKGDTVNIRYRSQHGESRYGFDISKIGVSY